MRSLSDINDIMCEFFCLSAQELKIIEILKNKWLTTHEVAKKLHLSRPAAQRYLKSLYSLGLLKRRFASPKKYQYKAVSEEELKELIKELADRWYQSILSILNESSHKKP